MLKDELRELATWGMRRKLEEMERTLAEYHREFPELFISEAPPVLLKAEPRADGGNGWAAPAAPRKAPGAMTDAILSLIRERGPMRYFQVRDALKLPNGSVSQVLRTLKEEGLLLHDMNTSMYRAAADAPAERTRKPIGRPRGSRDTSTVSAKVEAFLLAHRGARFSPSAIRKKLKLPRKAGKTVGSALSRLGATGRATHHDDGLWGTEAAATDDKPTKRRQGIQPDKQRHWKERWYVHLQAHGPERMSDSARALGADSGALYTSAKAWVDAGIIQKLSSGEYGIGKVQPEAGALAAADASQNGATA
jgi:hypothetical protein